MVRFIDRPRLTCTTIVRNETMRLPAMIRSVRPIAEEILLVDTGSTDGTQDLARMFGCQVLQFEWCDNFAAARNYGLEHARGHWILVLDADDRLLPAGVTAVRRSILWGHSKLRELGISGYCLCIEEQTFDGHVLGRATSSGRLFPRQNTLRYVGRVHEEVRYIPNPAATRWAVLDGVHVYHVGYDPSAMAEKYARNERLLKLSLEDDPYDVYAHFYLATQARNLEQHDDAAEWARRALLLDDHLTRLQPEHRATLCNILDMVV